MVQEVPADPLAEHIKKMDERHAETREAAKREKAKILLAQRRLVIKKAQEVRKTMIAHREIVKKKVQLNQPITEEERKLLIWKAGNRQGKTPEQLAEAAAARLQIKPASVSSLRLLVETTAAKHHYNPIEKLIQLTADSGVKQTDKIAIHKALLPFLCPVLATPKSTEQASEGIKVVVTQFQFPDQRSNGPLHQAKPVTVETTMETSAKTK